MELYVQTWLALLWLLVKLISAKVNVWSDGDLSTSAMRTLSHAHAGQAFIRTEETFLWTYACILCCMHVLHWDQVGGGGGVVQGFRLKSRDFGQPVQGSALSRLASMLGVVTTPRIWCQSFSHHAWNMQTCQVSLFDSETRIFLLNLTLTHQHYFSHFFGIKSKLNAINRAVASYIRHTVLVSLVERLGTRLSIASYPVFLVKTGYEGPI